jgi:hypothetical protein
VEIWEVDMVILPLGFQVYDKEVSDTISQALKKNIICLAAPGNAGANERIEFPARLPRVISIYATDGYGNPAPFNPSPLKGRKSFSTLGKDIECRWGGETVLRTGTALSVCIAGGILASIFDFIRNDLSIDGDDWETLHTPEGAEKLLELMSSSRGGYEYVAPWFLLSAEVLDSKEGNSDRRDILRGQILAALRQLR